MERYNHKKVEKKWQERWAKDGLYTASDRKEGAENFYALVEFPYPSGNLHVGHWYAFAVPDILVRAKRMQGYNVLFPIGFDAFGLPAENAAIKRGYDPRKWTYDNMDYMRAQIRSMGASFDWSREVMTCDPAYYKWTQWLFLQLFKKGLVTQRETHVNWCPSCKTVLANEQVTGGACERCGSEVEKKTMKQWNVAITRYAQRLLDGLDVVDWPEEIKQAQRNWIGRSEGAVVKFKVQKSKIKNANQNSNAVNSEEESIEVFTTRIDTIFSGTFLILAPEHEFIEKIKNKISNGDAVEEYIKQAKKKTETERTAEGKDKAGVDLKGITAVNPATGEEMPVWVADFVLAHYGTGAVFADAHDKRDFAFAKKYDIPLKVSVRPQDDAAWENVRNLKECYAEEGILIHSGQFDGLASAHARPKITAWLAEKGRAQQTVQYKLRDWTVSRQRYWGVPVPLIFCKNCAALPSDQRPTTNDGEKMNPGWFAVSDTALPVELPDIKDYLPTGMGKSPLAKVKSFVETSCPQCGGVAERETDTLDTFVDSSWYFLRYTDPRNDMVFADKKKLAAWMPVDLYSGGAEHTTMHLLYSRFFQKALFDCGLVDEEEPYIRRMNRGIILGPDGNKMSKSKGNVIDPDDIVAHLGADTLRLYLAFIGPYNEVGAYPWSTEGIIGMRRFLEKVWRIFQKATNEERQTTGDADLERLLHQTIKKVTEDIGNMKFNTAIAQLMIFVNALEKKKNPLPAHCQALVILLSPFMPHLCEEIWEKIGHTTASIFAQQWPSYDENLLQQDTVEIVVQVNGKVRDRITMAATVTEEEASAEALASEKVRQHIADKDVRKTIFVQGRLINFVI